MSVTVQMRRPEVVVAGALLLAANAFLWPGFLLLVQTLAALALTLALPGWLVMRRWAGGALAPTKAETLVYAAAAGFAVQTLTLLLLSYLPGPLARWQVLIAFNILCSALLISLWFTAHDARPIVAAPDAASAEPRPWHAVWSIIAPLVIVSVAGCLRFTNLGYAEFQGDEARAILRATAVLQGYDDVLFLHRKGPQEILAPAVSYALTGHLTEATARLPFALAGVAGVLAIYCLGRRIFGPLAGSVAALLLAVDGYFIAFARITQYQSIVLLMTVTSVLLLYQLRGHAAIRLLTLAAFLVAAGALAHYEAMLAVIPGAYLVWHWRQRTKPADFRTGLGAALMVGGGTLALFYLPYIVSPNFASVYSYLTEERIGGQPPYNHLADFFLRTTLYSTTYAVLLQIGLVTLGAFQLYQRTWRSPRSWLVMAAVGAGLVVTLFQPDWLLISGHSWTVLFFLVAFGSVWFLPGAGQAERMLWIWFGLLVLLSLFLIAKPRTHVYVFFIPWVLLCGMVVTRLTGRLAAARSPLVAHGLAASALAGCLLLFGSYAYWYFVYNRVEIFRTWSENRPAGFWTVYDQPDDQSIFGFPNRSGWKAVGVLYDQGVLQGAYTSRNTDEWVSDWYTRGADRCPRAHRYFMVSDRLGARETVRRENLLAELPATHQQWGVVTVYDEPRLEIWQRGGEPPTPQTLPIADYAAEFDARLSGPDFPLSAPAVEPVIQRPLAVQFGNQIVLEGYALDQDAIAAGATVQLTLYWRAREPVDTRYIVVNEVRRNEDGAAVAHAAGEPGCDAQRTTDWVVGELIADRYDLPIADGAEPGVYSVVTRMEERDTGSILPSSIGESVTLGAVRIEE